jgi:hypothetical protein
VRRPVLAAAVLAGLLLAGCTGGSDSDTAGGSGAAFSGSGDEAASSMGLTDGAAPAAAAPPGAAPPGADMPAGSAPLGRVVPAGASLIRTAELGVRVDDVRAAADRALDLAVTAGGTLASERSDGTGGERSARLTLRVPPDRFDATVAALASLGEERSRSLGTEDVTDQVVDLESRLATQRASVERVRALLDEAQNLGEVVQIEGELTRRTADLESLQARLAALTERVELSTITVTLYGGQAPTPVDDEVVGFADGLRGGWTAFLATARVLAATAGALLPFLPIALVGWLGWRLRARRAAVPTP